MELLFNHQGIPLIGFAHNFLAYTTGTPSSSAAAPHNEDPETFDSQKIYPWGSGNNFPDDAEAIIRKFTVRIQD